MKKLIVIALAVVMMVSAVAVLAACGTTYEGECSYTVTDWNSTYGVKVKVTVNGDKIAKVELVDYDQWVRTTADNPANGWTSHDTVEDAYPSFLQKFEGKTIDEVKAIKVTVPSGNITAAESYTVGVDAAYKADWSITGGTQSSARVIAAVQNALSKVK